MYRVYGMVKLDYLSRCTEMFLTAFCIDLAMLKKNIFV